MVAMNAFAQAAFGVAKAEPDIATLQTLALIWATGLRISLVLALCGADVGAVGFY
jgi:hypothetical protein